jgi:hypothetical protein
LYVDGRGWGLCDDLCRWRGQWTMKDAVRIYFISWNINKIILHNFLDDFSKSYWSYWLKLYRHMLRLLTTIFHLYQSWKPVLLVEEKQSTRRKSSTVKSYLVSSTVSNCCWMPMSYFSVISWWEQVTVKEIMMMSALY